VLRTDLAWGSENRSRFAGNWHFGTSVLFESRRIAEFMEPRLIADYILP
jgi:hypothetical protein